MVIECQKIFSDHWRQHVTDREIRLHTGLNTLTDYNKKNNYLNWTFKPLFGELYPQYVLECEWKLECERRTAITVLETFMTSRTCDNCFQH